MTEFLWPIRVYYEDTDSGGVVYYANYLKFMERARTELLRATGFEQDVLRDERQLLFVVRHVELDLHQPARFNEQLVVRTAIAKVHGASISFVQSIVREGEAQLLCEATVQVVCINATDWKPARLPADIKQSITTENPGVD
ncbi:MAG: tol-pal system-associated acyl-CoA thioesterase [Granulosicoccaceae bacterium]